MACCTALCILANSQGKHNNADFPVYSGIAVADVAANRSFFN
jgi:hypothetical protein